MNCRVNAVTGWALLLAGSCWTSSNQTFAAEAAFGGSLQAWQPYRDSVLADPALLRFYVFDGSLAENRPVPSLTGTDGPLKYEVAAARGAPSEALRTVPGRWPGKQAVRLDQGLWRGAAFAVAQRAFTVEAWLRKHGPGAHRGNAGAPNGTLLSAGNGYWDGWRLTTTYPAQTVRFEIGRPQPSHSVGIQAGPLEDAAWQHVAVSWDGQEMRLYLNGRLSARGEFTGNFTPPQDGSLRLGYANAGVGSVILDVDEVAVFNRALGAEEILAHALVEAALPPTVANGFRAAGAAMATSNWSAAESAWATVVELKEASNAAKAVARRQLAEVLMAQKQFPAAATQLVHAANDATVPARLVRAADAQLTTLFRDAPGQVYSPAVYARLSAMTDLAPAERMAVQLSLAHSAFAAGDFAAARKQYATLVSAPETSAAWRSLVQLRLAESFVRETNFTDAKRAFNQLLALPDAPAHLRQEAEERRQEIERTQAGLPARDPAAARLARPEWPLPGLTLHVAPTGADSNPGTRERPFATLERARDALRQLRRQDGLPAGGAEVRVRGGEYAVTRTFALGAEDSGTATSPIIYRAHPGEVPRFNGGARVTGFAVVTRPDLLARLPANARGRVLQADLKALGITNWGPLVLSGYSGGRGFKTHPTFEVFFNGEPMQLARWPNDGFTEVGELRGQETFSVWGRLQGIRDGQFTYREDRPVRWAQEPAVWLYGYWFWDWADGYELVASVEAEKQLLTLAPPYHRYGYRSGQRYYALNVFAELDQPGEWYLDRDAGTLFFYPPSDPRPAVVEVSLCREPMLALNQVSNVVFRQLTWELGQGDAVRIEGGERCLLAGCTIRRFGGTGVEIQGGTGHGLLSCDIHTLGRGGVVLRGGDRRTLTPGGHFVENCHVHHLSRVDHTYTPAVLVDGVGQRVAHNHFHDSFSSALRVEGNEHRIEFNDVHHVLLESDDQGGADMFGNPTYRGNVYRYNYWHQLGNGLGTGQAGIRLDDAICGTLIYGNVFYRCADGNFGGVQIHGGKENIVDNNLFIECQAAVSFSAWPKSRWENFLEERKGLLAAVQADQPPYLARYPTLARLRDGANQNRLWRNLAYRCERLLLRDPGQQELVDNALLGDDPGLVDAAHGDFQFKADAAGLKQTGFRPIPFREIGLYPDEFRR